MDGRNPHLLIARIASAVIAFGSIHAVALGNSVDPESQIVVLTPVEAHVATGGSWISIFAFGVLCVLGVALWLRAKPDLQGGRGVGFLWKLFSKGNSKRAVGNGAIEILDRAVMAKGQALTLVRVGDRVVLLGQSSQGFQRLAEFAADSSEAVNAIAEHAERDHSVSDLRRRVG
ncbi:MAG: hypothetical protein EXS12_06085 [Phycisphaerales bacterium]|nr:hypothetical protein [Phycisphaerales bacterium]